MVITLVKNGSPDMIPTPFEGKFDEKKDEIPPEAHRPQKSCKKQCVKVNHQKNGKKTMSKKCVPKS